MPSGIRLGCDSVSRHNLCGMGQKKLELIDEEGRMDDTRRKSAAWYPACGPFISTSIDEIHAGHGAIVNAMAG